MPMSNGPLDNNLECPVCRATQVWADSCRRCRCDLRLLRRADAARRNARQEVLLHLGAGDWAEAQRAAKTYHTLQPSADSRRLLSVCCLLAGDFQRAVEWAALAPDRPLTMARQC